MTLVPGSWSLAVDGAHTACPRPQPLVLLPVPSHHPHPTGRLQPSCPAPPAAAHPLKSAASTPFQCCPSGLSSPQVFLPEDYGAGKAAQSEGAGASPPWRPHSPQTWGQSLSGDTGRGPRLSTQPSLCLSSLPPPRAGPLGKRTGSSGRGELPCGRTGLPARGAGPVLAPVLQRPRPSPAEVPGLRERRTRVPRAPAPAGWAPGDAERHVGRSTAVRPGARKVPLSAPRAVSRTPGPALESGQCDSSSARPPAGAALMPGA